LRGWIVHVNCATAARVDWVVPLGTLGSAHPNVIPKKNETRRSRE
jgi:hypothetical protein